MKRIALLAIMVFSVIGGVAASSARADWQSLSYGGHQPLWNPMHYFNNCHLNCEERKLQRFWHDYYNAQRRYYHSLSHLDWLTYYKNHGQCVGGGAPGPYGQGGPMQYAPVTVAPQMNWANPQNAGYYPNMGVPGQGAPGMGAPGMGAGMPQGAGGMMPASYAAPGAFPGYYGYPSMGSGLVPAGY